MLFYAFGDLTILPSPVVIRSSSLITFPIQYLEMVEGLVRACDGDVQLIYQHCGLTLAEINDPETRLTIPQFVALMEFSKQYLNSDEPASRQLMRYMPVTINGMVGMAVMSADTLGDALDIGLRYFPLIMPCIELLREDRGNKVYIRVKTLVRLGSPFDETLVEVVIGNILKVVQFSETTSQGKALSQLLGAEVHFRHSPRGKIESYQKYNNVSLKFSSLEDQLILPREGLHFPLVTRNRSTRLTLESMLDSKLLLLHSYNQVAVRVRRLLSAYVEQGNYPESAQIADMLALSTRTLSRRLSEEGYTLSKLIEEVRMERAETLLISTSLPLSNIAKQLGYSDLSAFSRAFKRVKKQSPSELRASLKG
ncbi:AraC family transcriptional regulator [Aquirhabdus parva]|uniref:AraC family transcriptional regulator n=1 Tax=Aquirhabdus parva TaxID=2283318 RepID=A0A345P9S7_9GAMM|nr:AraC family transcriptional regulator [Aquirhabdus parva]